MKALQKLGTKIGGLVLIAPAIDPAFSNAEAQPFWKTFSWDIDYRRLQNLTSFRFVLSDLQELRRTPYLRELSKKLDAQLIETKAVKEHFRGDKEPDILMCLRPTIRVF